MVQYRKIHRISSERSRESFYGRRMRKRNPQDIEVKLVSMVYGEATRNTLWVLMFMDKKAVWVLKTERGNATDNNEISQVEFAGHTLSEATLHMTKQIISPYRSSTEFSSHVVDALEEALRRYLQQ